MTVGKRHHTVPLLLLRRFSSSPTANAPPLWKLDTESGRRWETNARIETVIDHYYRLEDASLPLAPGAVEDLLSRIESDAAEPVRRLVLGASLITGTALTPREREMMAIFLHVQRQRTPTARAWLAFLDEQMQTEFVKLRLSDLQSTKAFLIAEGDPRTDEEIEAWRAETLAALESGEIGFESGHTREVGLIFFGLEPAVQLISQRMTWWSMRAPTGTGFICSDNPLNLYDPGSAHRPEQHAGVGWNSSIAVQATLPLDPTVCLLLTPGPPTWRMKDVQADAVAELNLRTYAAAQQFIYGPSEQSVQDVWSHARRHQALVENFRPRPPQITMLEQTEGAALPSIVATHRPPRKSFRRPRKKPGKA